MLYSYSVLWEALWLDPGSSGLDSGQRHCVLFLGETLNSLSASLCTGVDGYWWLILLGQLDRIHGRTCNMLVSFHGRAMSLLDLRDLSILDTFFVPHFFCSYYPLVKGNQVLHILVIYWCIFLLFQFWIGGVIALGEYISANSEEVRSLNSLFSQATESLSES